MARRRASFWAATALVFLAGCHLIGGLDGYVEGSANDDDGGGAGATTSTGGSGATGGNGTGASTSSGGGAAPMCDEANCSAQSTDCAICACVGQLECDCDPVATGTACTTEATPGVCDADGSCVECLQPSDCAGGLFCDEKNCVPAGCSDMTVNGNETGIDCGGPDCAPCPEGQNCNVDSDCATYKCVNVCVFCQAPEDCPSDRYCSNMYCVPKKGVGQACEENYECISNQCDACGFGSCFCALF